LKCQVWKRYAFPKGEDVKVPKQTKQEKQRK